MIIEKIVHIHSTDIYMCYGIEVTIAVWAMNLTQRSTMFNQTPVLFLNKTYYVQEGLWNDHIIYTSY